MIHNAPKIAELLDTFGAPCGEMLSECDEFRTIGVAFRTVDGEGYIVALCQKHLFEFIEAHMYSRNLGEGIDLII